MQDFLNSIHNFGQGVDALGRNVYNGIRSTTMNFDKTFGFPDDRNNTPLLNPAPSHYAQAPLLATPPPQQHVLAAHMQAPLLASPTQTPNIAQRVVNTFNPDTMASSDSNPFGDFTTAKVPDKYSQLIANSAKQYGIDPNIFASVLFHEHGFSDTPGFNYNTDGSYDRGIAQINSHAHPDVTDKQALDPNFAIPYSARLLANYIKGQPDLAHGIAAYNVGPNGAKDPQIYKTKGINYLNGVKAGLTPQLIKKLGL